MKTLSAVLTVVALLACGAVCRADITSAYLSPYCSSCVSCSSHDLTCDAPGEFHLCVDCTAYTCGTGQLSGAIITDTDDDPKLTLLHQVDNDSGTAWTDYHAMLTMGKFFTLDNLTVGNSGWTAAATQPVEDSYGNWVGYIDYTGGTPIGLSDTLSFGYRMTFTGSANLSEQLTPSTAEVPVPEPTTLALAAFGLAGLLVVRRKFAR